MHTPDTFTLSDGQIESLQNGAVAIFPTETIYGIGCSAWCDDALLRIFQIKGRAPDQPPPILIHDREQLSTLAARISPLALFLMEHYWPGALTLILPASNELSPLLCGLAANGTTHTVGIRLTNHPISRVLCEQIGVPLIATSANFSGAIGRAAAPQSLADIPDSFKAQVDVIVDGGVLRGVPSTVVDCASIPPRVVRAGAVAISDDDLQTFHQNFHRLR